MTDCFLSGNAVYRCQEVPYPTSVGVGEKLKVREETRAGVGHAHTQGRFCQICRVATRQRRFLLPQPTPFPDGQTDFIRYRRPSFSPWFHFCFSGELVLLRVTYLFTSSSILV